MIRFKWMKCLLSIYLYLCLFTSFTFIFLILIKSFRNNGNKEVFASMFLRILFIFHVFFVLFVSQDKVKHLKQIIFENINFKIRFRLLQHRLYWAILCVCGILSLYKFLSLLSFSEAAAGCCYCCFKKLL